MVTEKKKSKMTILPKDNLDYGVARYQKKRKTWPASVDVRHIHLFLSNLGVTRGKNHSTSISVRTLRSKRGVNEDIIEQTEKDNPLFKGRGKEKDKEAQKPDEDTRRHSVKEKNRSTPPPPYKKGL